MASEWISDGEKYALLGLPVKVNQEELAALDLGLEFSVLKGSEFRIPSEWREWLGSIRAEQVDSCDIFVATRMRASAPDVLDGENQQLQQRVWRFYLGLLLGSMFATAHQPLILTGTCHRTPRGARTGPIDFHAAFGCSGP